MMSDEGCWRVGVLAGDVRGSPRTTTRRARRLLAASRCLVRDFKASGAPVLACAPDVATFAPSARSRSCSCERRRVRGARRTRAVDGARDDGRAPADAAESVVDTAARAGSTDDITAMVLVFRREPAKPGPALPEEGEAPRASPREDA